ncbi:SIMPL domain-containing protein [Brevibacillus borstelensis]|uniref:SIMPL domain-containing protein n=1 Tax=Brevibacillus borstelensis TaxID=45462 RepID=UPI0030BBF7A4
MYPHQSMSHFPLQPTSQDHYVIKVTGEGTIYTAPDQAVAILGTITENKNLQLAQTTNAEAVSQIIQSLMKLGIPQELIKTIRYQIEIEYQYHEGKQIFQGYKVTHMLQVIIGQIEQTGLVVDTAVENGANTVSSIQFTVRDPEYYYNQALVMAVKDSQQKAATIARTLGVRYNPIPHQVQEMTSAPEPVTSRAEAFLARATTPIQPGEIKIRASVHTEFSFAPC